MTPGHCLVIHSHKMDSPALHLPPSTVPPASMVPPPLTVLPPPSMVPPSLAVLPPPSMVPSPSMVPPPPSMEPPPLSVLTPPLMVPPPLTVLPPPLMVPPPSMVLPSPLIVLPPLAVPPPPLMYHTIDSTTTIDGTISSINGTASSINGTTTINSTASSINGTASSINGTASSINGTTTINGTASSINGTTTINGTASSTNGTTTINGTTSSIDGTTTINSTASSIDGTTTINSTASSIDGTTTIDSTAFSINGTTSIDGTTTINGTGSSSSSINGTTSSTSDSTSTIDSTTSIDKNLKATAALKSNTAPEPAIVPKKTKKTKKTSVQHLNEDLVAEAAGPPLKLTRTEHILEKSGVTVAPPQRDQSATATIPPPPVCQVSSHVHQSDIAQMPAETILAKIIPASIIGTGDTASPEKSSSELLDPKETIDHFSSGSDFTSSQQSSSELQPEITADYSGSGSGSGSKFDINSDSTSSNEGEDMVTPHKVADGKHPRPISPISPSVSHHTKSGQLSVAHSSATSESATHEPSPASPESELPVIEDDLQGSSKVTGGFAHGHTALFNMADKDDEMEIDFATPQPIQGRVLLYLDHTTDAIPHTTMTQDVQSKLAPILEQLSGCYSPVAKSNPHIFVQEDNTWFVKGQYIKAIKENETVKWIASTSGQLTLPSIVEGLNLNLPQTIDFDALSLASSHSGSHSASISASTPAPQYDFAEDSIQYCIATTLNIPFALTDC
ncbi:hypothetical protein BDQ12DRAFT_728172 [Crucibulum laeve]|uniref:Uncharacterized protein n=1 Tax=Crucibulum laeve TaxID=68775 RepID=A0A5C3LW40_9AGAR|nr:hypothetical protein BDQ12DRAFT_728172 [Crucibulum laeve]